MDSRDGYQENSGINETVYNNGSEYFSNVGACILLLINAMDMHGAMAERC